MPNEEVSGRERSDTLDLYKHWDLGWSIDFFSRVYLYYLLISGFLFFFFFFFFGAAVLVGFPRGRRARPEARGHVDTKPAWSWWLVGYAGSGQRAGRQAGDANTGKDRS
jgi:hypothetical protein